MDKMPLAEAPPRGSRFGSPLVLSRVHWVRPEMVVEVGYLTWTEDGLLRHVVYLGEREDKPAAGVRRGHRRYEPPLDTSASAHPLPMAMETWPGRMSSMFAPAIFIRPGDRIAPTATRYPAPSQPPQQERSGEKGS